MSYYIETKPKKHVIITHFLQSYWWMWLFWTDSMLVLHQFNDDDDGSVTHQVASESCGDSLFVYCATIVGFVGSIERKRENWSLLTVLCLQ